MAHGTMSSLLLAVRDRIRARLGLDPGECELMPDGRPPAAAGQLFLAVHPGELSLDDPLAELWESSSAVGLTCTMKAGDVPHDRMGEHLAEATTGLLDRMEDAVKAVHMSYTVLDAARVYLGGDGAQYFVEPLRLTGGIPRPAEKPPSWFWSEDRQTAPAGWAVEVKMAAAKRYEALPGASED
jgi:hypothetical protein